MSFDNQMPSIRSISDYRCTKAYMNGLEQGLEIYKGGKALSIDKDNHVIHVENKISLIKRGLKLFWIRIILLLLINILCVDVYNSFTFTYLSFSIFCAIMFTIGYCFVWFIDPFLEKIQKHLK